MQMEELTPVQRDRLLLKVSWDELEKCWPWKAALNACGYGILGHNGRTWLAHKLMWHWLRYPVPQGHELDHTCRVRACVNPNHLRVVTHKDNMKVGAKALKTHCPAGHPYAGDNLLIDKHSGGRRCKICRVSKLRAANQRRKHGKAKG